jgi:hypothetical protein
MELRDYLHREKLSCSKFAHRLNDLYSSAYINKVKNGVYKGGPKFWKSVEQVTNGEVKPLKTIKKK